MVKVTITPPGAGFPFSFEALPQAKIIDRATLGPHKNDRDDYKRGPCGSPQADTEAGWSHSLQHVFYIGLGDIYRNIRLFF